MLRLTITFSALCLAACTAMVPSTALQLMSLSPLTADPAALAVRIDLPKTIGIQPDSAKLTLSNTYRDEIAAHTYTLDRPGDASLFRIAPKDVAGLRDLQTKIRAQEDTAPQENSGSLSVTASPCLKSDFASLDDRVSVSIRTAPDGAFLPLFRDQPLSKLFGPTDLSALPLCDIP